MRVKIFLVLLLCALQQVHGSKSPRTGGSRLKKWVKNCLITLALNYGANEVVNAERPQVADSNSLACKYNVPDQNAEVMMNFVKCAKDQDFEKYMLDNSENCPKINELYKQTEINGNCPLNIPKNIPEGALARFRGERLSLQTNGEMLMAYCEYKDGAFFESEVCVSAFWDRQIYFGKDGAEFDFFRFMDILELTELAYPDDAKSAIMIALDYYKEVNKDNAKGLLELTKLAYPDPLSMEVRMALIEFKDANAGHAKQMMELTKLAIKSVPDNAWMVVKMALDSEYRGVNVDQVKRVLELTKILNPTYPIAEALKPKYIDINVEKVNKKYQDLKNSRSWSNKSEEYIMKKALKMTYPEIIKEDF